MKINATILKILYPKEAATPSAKTWYVLATTSGRVVGASRLFLREGHVYTFTGDYENYQGVQNFKFASVTEEIPIDPRALLNYACTCTKGLGPAFADKMWSKYGEDYLKKLDEKGASLPYKEAYLLETLQAFRQDAARTNAIAGLISKGATQHLAEIAYERFKGETLSLVRDNPYILAELPGQSFATIDERLRQPFNIPLHSPLRARALIAYLISSIAESSGDTVIGHDRIIQEALSFNIPEAVLRATLTAHFVLLPSGVTTQKLHEHERTIFNYLNHHAALDAVTIADTGDITLDDSQTFAILSTLNRSGVSIINGGAGCGKTTIIKTIAQSLTDAKQLFRLASFAGKAAARIREATGFPASTIHSLLGYIPDIGFTVGSLQGLTIIIDEASMVPAYLMAEICKRNPDRLVLVGDEAQLPPVGAGAPFHDLVAYGLANTVTTCYRNSEAIFRAAYAVRNSQPPKPDRSEHETFTIVGVNGPKEAQEYVENICKHLDFASDIIIAPRNGVGEDTLPAAVVPLNAAVMKHIGQKAMLEAGGRIICLKNDPEVGVWNGTTGRIDAVDIDNKVFLTTDDGSEVILPKAYTKKEVAPAYALTVHKAQGSQYRRVVILALRRDSAMLLDRPMLYTAITRAKEGCVVITDMPLNAIANKVTHRQTVLQDLLSNIADEAGAEGETAE